MFLQIIQSSLSFPFEIFWNQVQYNTRYMNLDTKSRVQLRMLNSVISKLSSIYLESTNIEA